MKDAQKEGNSLNDHLLSGDTKDSSPNDRASRPASNSVRLPPKLEEVHCGILLNRTSLGALAAPFDPCYGIHDNSFDPVDCNHSDDDVLRQVVQWRKKLGIGETENFNPIDFVLDGRLTEIVRGAKFATHPDLHFIKNSEDREVIGDGDYQSPYLDLTFQGVTLFKEKLIVLPNHVFERARAGDWWALHSLMHEIGHLVLHYRHSKRTHRNCSSERNNFSSAEYSASLWAASFLAPPALFLVGQGVKEFQTERLVPLKWARILESMYEARMFDRNRNSPNEGRYRQWLKNKNKLCN